MQSNPPSAHEQEWRAILEREPENVGISQALGESLLAAGRFNEAAALYERIVAIDPRHAEAWHRLGVLRRQSGDPNQAMLCIHHAIALNPNSAEMHYNLGNALIALHRDEDAAASFRRAIALNPNFALAHNNLGNTLDRLNRPMEALEQFHRALQFNPNLAEAAANAGSLLYRQGRCEEALAYARRAVELNPQSPDAHWNEALILLALGDFERGFEKHEWRWKLSRLPPRDLPGPRWQGEKLAGKTILLYGEQGFGDAILALRYVPMLAELGARVIVEVQAPLASLARSVNGVTEIISQGEPLPAHDFHCALLSLPLRLRTRLNTIPADVPYLAAEAARAKRWRRRLKSKDQHRIGFVWAGSPHNPLNTQRSVPVEMFSPLFDIPGIRWYSLQVGDRAADLARLPPDRVVDLSQRLNDFAETAAAIENLDLVISVDTAVAHLAGALGRPVWTLLPVVSDWRWLRHPDGAPRWYPGMRIFRQTTAGDWGAVIARVRDELLTDRVTAW